MESPNATVRSEGANSILILGSDGKGSWQPVQLVFTSRDVVVVSTVDFQKVCLRLQQSHHR